MSASAQCTRCLQWLPVSAFNARREARSRLGRQSWCKSCHNWRMREYKRSLTPEARAQDAREKRLRKYGISGAIFDQMVAAQDGRCGICFERPPDDEILNVDHCHASGEVRGLLCRSCNTALGLLGDDASRLRSALAYLTRGARAYHDCSLLSANERPLP